MTGTQSPGVGFDLYEVAYLAGGTRRVVETAVVALVGSGRLRVTRPTGQLHVVDLRRRHPVEAAVLDAAGPRARRSVDGLYWRIRTDGRLTALAEGLQRAGLVSGRGGADSTRDRSWALAGLTRAGRRTLRRLRQDPPASLTAGDAGALEVALAGPGAWPDAELRSAVFDPPRPALPPSLPGEVALARYHQVPYAGYAGGGVAGFGGGLAGGGFGGDCGGGGGDGGGGC